MAGRLMVPRPAGYDVSTRPTGNGVEHIPVLGALPLRKPGGRHPREA